MIQVEQATTSAAGDDQDDSYDESSDAMMMCSIQVFHAWCDRENI